MCACKCYARDSGDLLWLRFATPPGQRVVRATKTHHRLSPWPFGVKPVTWGHLMKAVILAAGKGTRMGELTAHVPKPMKDVEGKPILQHIVEGLRAKAGIEDIFIITAGAATSFAIILAMARSSA